MCDEVQGTYALTIAGQGGDAVLVAGANDLDRLAMRGMRGCVDACPTGALVEPGLADPRPIETITRRPAASAASDAAWTCRPETAPSPR